MNDDHTSEYRLPFQKKYTSRPMTSFEPDSMRDRNRGQETSLKHKIKKFIDRRDERVLSWSDELVEFFVEAFGRV